jgi:hypothetical protein
MIAFFDSITAFYESKYRTGGGLARLDSLIWDSFIEGVFILIISTLCEELKFYRLYLFYTLVEGESNLCLEFFLNIVI